MRNKLGILLILLGAVVLGATVLLVMQPNQQQILPLSVQIDSIDKKQQISCWSDSEGAYYIFLPSYADLSKTKILLNTNVPIWLDGRQLSEGDVCDRFLLNVPYELNYVKQHINCKTTLTFMKSSNISSIYIDTYSGNMDYIHAKKGNEETAILTVYDCNGMLSYQGTQVTIKGRGNATWELSEKKPYSIKLDQEMDLLGMGSAEKWILLANSQDASNIRNKLTSDMARIMGLPYVGEAEWIDLYLNGSYAGLYLLCERNEIHKQRINLVGDNFLVSMEQKSRLDNQHYPYVMTERGLPFRLHYPMGTETDHTAKVERMMQAVENALFSEKGIDPVTDQNWDSLIDTDSWARMFLMSEIIGNLDSYRASQFFFSNVEDGRIYAGPIWDSDKALGNDNDSTWSITNPDTFVVCRYINDTLVGPEWVRNLLKKEKFYEKVVDLFQDEFSPVIESSLEGIIQEYEATINSAFEMNRIRWKNELSSGSMQEETAQVRDYIRQHMRFLHSVWIDKIHYCQVNFLGIPNVQFMSIVAGETLTSLPAVEDVEAKNFLGWYYSDTDEPFDISKPITEDIEIYAKWAEKPSKKLDQLIKLTPLGIIAFMGLGLLWIEVNRWKRRR